MLAVLLLFVVVVAVVVVVGVFGREFSSGRSRYADLCSRRIVASVVQRCSVITFDSERPCRSFEVVASLWFV